MSGKNTTDQNSALEIKNPEEIVDELLEMDQIGEKIEIRCDGMIRYSDHKSNRVDKEYKTINHEDLTLEFFQKQRGFYEIHREQYIRPHFDFDFKKCDEVDDDEIFNIIDFLDSYKSVCGEYELQGYSSDKRIYRTIKQFANVFEFKPNADKLLSFHVVYRGKFVDRDDWFNYHCDAKVLFNNMKIEFDPQIYVRNLTRDKKTKEVRATQHPFRMMGFAACDYNKMGKDDVKLTWRLIKDNGLDRSKMKLKNFVRSIVTPSSDDVLMKCKDLVGIDGVKFEFKDKFQIERDYSDEKWRKDKNTIMYRYFQYFNDKCFKNLLRNRKVGWMKNVDKVRTFGYYYPETQRITIASSLGFEQARSTLLHEMCHAAQFELDKCDCGKPHCVKHFQVRAHECMAITGITVKTTKHDDDILDIIEDTSMIGDEEEQVQAMGDKLFDLIINGFASLPEGVQIHHTQNGEKIVDRISLFSLFTRLFACEKFGIDRERIHAGIKKIQKNGDRISENAWENWDEQVEKHENEPHENYYSLVEQLKRHHPKYYEEFLKPSVPEQLLVELGDHEKFENSEYTLNQFVYDFSDGKFQSTAEMGKKLSFCLAINTYTNGFIARRREDDGNISIKTYNSKQIREFMGDNRFKYDLSEEEKEKLRSQKKRVRDSVEISLYEALNKVEYRKLMKQYDGVKLLTDKEGQYQIYRPPNGKYDEKLINEWLRYMREDRIENPEAFDELLHSHSYRFRHPEVFIEKFFINYGTGGDGKGFMNACFNGVYPKLSNVGCRQEQIEQDMFNSWMSEKLLIWLEEAETGRANFMDKKIHTRVKQMSSENSSTRGMHRETEENRNWAIVGMNTNDPTLYGLTRGDDAVKQRLVILKFKKPWNDTKAFHVKNHSFTDNPNFSYSLYHYLKFIHEIPAIFNPSRYYGEDKQRIIEELNMLKKTVVEEWLKNHTHLFIEKKMRNDGGKLMIASVNQVIESYNEYVKRGNDRFAPSKVNDTLIKFGFQEKNMKIGNHQSRHWYIGRDKFDELTKKLCGEDDDFIELMDDEEEFNCSDSL